jgi:hypothetical protein
LYLFFAWEEELALEVKVKHLIVFFLIAGFFSSLDLAMPVFLALTHLSVLECNVFLSVVALM